MIFSLFGKKKESVLAPQLLVDVHSHLLPGIDDGSKSIEESISLLKAIQNIGYKKIITTPHVMSDAYPNTPQIIYNALNTLRVEAEKNEILLEIEAAAEYYIDDSFITHLKKRDILTINDKYLLFETSYFAKPLQLEDIIFEMTSLGYIPLMAHPERYRYVKDSLKEYSRFKELGVMFQVNINSLGGFYGRDAKSKSEFLAKEGMIDFLGSDIHGMKQVETISTVFQSNLYNEVYKHNTILNNTLL